CAGRSSSMPRHCAPTWEPTASGSGCASCRPEGFRMLRSPRSTATGSPAAPGPALAVVAPDDAIWDAFVQQHPQGHLLQAPGWGARKARFVWVRWRVGVAGTLGVLAREQVPT